MEKITRKHIHYDEKFGFIKIYGDEYCFSPGFRNLSFNGENIFNFTVTQGSIIAFLFKYHEIGVLGATPDDIRNHLRDLKIGQIESEEEDFKKVKENPLSENIRIRAFFRHQSKTHSAWGTFIKQIGAGKGTRYYLDFNWIPESH